VALEELRANVSLHSILLLSRQSVNSNLRRNDQPISYNECIVPLGESNEVKEI